MSKFPYPIETVDQMHDWSHQKDISKELGYAEGFSDGQFASSEQIRELKAQRDQLLSALDPNQTKYSYIGEIKDIVRIERYDALEDEFVEDTIEHIISWTAIKEIMNMIRNEAKLTQHLLKVKIEC